MYGREPQNVIKQYQMNLTVVQTNYKTTLKDVLNIANINNFGKECLLTGFCKYEDQKNYVQILTPISKFMSHKSVGYLFGNNIICI